VQDNGVKPLLSDILKVRLFGFGIPYRSLLVDGTFEPVETSPQIEATELAQELSRFRHKNPESGDSDDTWAVSVPFGRCGIEGLPREHLMLFSAQQAFLDVLAKSGPREIAINPGQIIAVEPQTVVRVRAKPHMGRRVVVAFQTQDRTPLLGNAAPFTLDGQIPDAYDDRLRKGHQAFAKIEKLWTDDKSAYNLVLENFFRLMSDNLAQSKEALTIIEKARTVGSYSVVDERVFLDYQRSLIDDELLNRIRVLDDELFRFPGMFGGITTLFNYLK
tara:strand:+ start:2418 stop:3242 length:825 start_codon:yes stop_codon:yes gene_type:complete